MINRHAYKCFSAMLAIAVAGLATPDVFAQPCSGCHTPATPKNRNPDRREGRPDLPPETDARDSSVRPPQVPEIVDSRAAPASSSRAVTAPGDPTRNARDGFTLGKE